MNRGEIVVITGANSGIGKAAAKKFASADYHVTMACRNIIRSESVRQEIVSLTGNGKVDLMELDVSSFGSIKKFVLNFMARYPKLDILINYAGYFKHDEKVYRLSADNIELTIAPMHSGRIC